MNQSTIPIKLDSCSVVIDTTEVSLWEKFPRVPISTRSRQQVPLGSIRDGLVRKTDLVLSQHRHLDVFEVELDSNSEDILYEIRDDTGNVTLTRSQEFAIFWFYEESVATRVLQAFKHASDLCRGKEPF
jgi:hypothetical protein